MPQYNLPVLEGGISGTTLSNNAGFPGWRNESNGRKPGARPVRLTCASRRPPVPEPNTMRQPARPLFTAALLLRRLPGCQRGAMLVEFAVALPALLVLYSGAYTLSDMVACQRKVTAATHQLTDLVARANTLAPDDVSGVLAASAQVLAPYAGARATITVSEVQLAPNGTASVVWSQSLNGTALNPGSAVPLPAGLSKATPRACGVLILGQVRYAYVPAISLGTGQAIDLTDALAMSPRYGPQVALDGAALPAPCA